MRSDKAESILAKVRSLPTPRDITFADITVTVECDVYPTGELSDLVVECLSNSPYRLQSGASVLDYGTGTGFLAVAAARMGAGRVVALDINPAAVACATKNVARYGLEGVVSVRQSDCLNALDLRERFDLILAGMPFEASDVSSVLERSVYDPNFEMRSSLFLNAPSILSPNGRIFTTYSERVQAFQPLERLAKGFAVEKIGKRVIKGELNFVFALTPQSAHTRDNLNTTFSNSTLQTA